MAKEEWSPQNLVARLLADPQSILERELAILRFSAWLNWPSNGDAGNNLALLITLDALEAGLISTNRFGKWFSNVLSLEPVLRQLREGGLFTPEFLVTGDLREGPEAGRYVADVVRFLLSFKPKSPDPRDRPSLGKAMVFLQTRGYGQTYPMSEATLQDVWRTYKQTAPFQFVRVYCSEVDWLFDPADDHLLFELAALATSKELTKYFAKSLWIQNKLRLIVDPRSLAPTDYFCFPETLVPEPCRIPRTRTSAYKILNDYSRNRFGTLFRVV